MALKHDPSDQEIVDGENTEEALILNKREKLQEASDAQG
jgi:hypothetical protein